MKQEATAKKPAEHAKLTLELMEKHEIPPDPKNYAVWYHYSLSENKDLVQEVDAIIKQSVQFTEDTCAYIHNKYLEMSDNRHYLDEASIGTQKILAKVVTIIKDFGRETINYTNDIDQYLERLCSDVVDDSIKEIFKELIESTLKMKTQSVHVTQYSEESTKEIAALRKRLQEVTKEARFDSLTNLLTRKAFDSLVDEHMRTATKDHSNLCLLMIDIDRFKQFNDRYGHLLGDEVLKIVARTLTETLKGRDVVARFGGEEFVAILSHTPIVGAKKVAEQIRSAISDKELTRKHTGERCGSITVSIGIARFRPGVDTLPTLIARADEALYKSKRDGRNCITCEDH